jgi:pectin methylesterase-like acyl-CoA thioesterase
VPERPHSKPRRQLSRTLPACIYAFALGAAEAAQARDYFVNPTDAGAFRTLQSAVDAVAGQSETDRANIFIAPGRYVERVSVGKPFVTFIGQGLAPADVVISFNKTPTETPVKTLGETVSIQPAAIAFMARNLTFENSTPDSSQVQALALRCDADRAIFDNARFLGYQDTLLVWNLTRQYVRNSFITGDIDFIFGNATAVFDRCIIESTGQGYITAADTRRQTANGLIFLDCQLVKGASRHDGTTPSNSSVFLGRPWLNVASEQKSSVIYIRARMGTHIKAAGWDPWDSILSPLIDRDTYTRFSEWGSMNLAGQLLADTNQDGTADGRVHWADMMTAAQAANYTLSNIFGPVDFWNAVTQPETSDRPYVSQGEPWSVQEQLLSLPAKPGARPQLLNISTRFRVNAVGQTVGIGGFIVTGTAPKKVIVRAIGPSLRSAGLANFLADPVLELHGGAQDTLIAKNDDWRSDAAASELQSMGMMPSDEREAATVITLVPGQYTAVISASDGSAGTALVEMYDVDPVADTQFGNVSTLGFVGTGDDALIGGFVVSGPGAAKIVVRAIGPSLTTSGVHDAIEDPALAVHDSHGNVTSNDDWQTMTNGDPIPVALRPGDPRESAIEMSLAPGSYTVMVRGKGDTTGVALVEAYNVQ